MARTLIPWFAGSDPESAPSAVKHSDGLGSSSGNVVRYARFADIVIRIKAAFVSVPIRAIRGQSAVGPNC